MRASLVPRPCLEDWNQLTPEARGHHCQVCSTKVWNLSSLTEDEARAFLEARRGEDLCVSYRERADGSIVHRAPPFVPPVVPLSRLVRRLPAAAGLSLALAGCTPASKPADAEVAPDPGPPMASADEGEAPPEPDEEPAHAETGDLRDEPAPTTANPDDLEPPPDAKPNPKPDPHDVHVKGKWVPAEELEEDTKTPDDRPRKPEVKKGKVQRIEAGGDLL